MSKHAPHIVTHRANVAKRGIETPSGFDAYGFPVPGYRKSAALANYRDMNPDISTEDATRDIDHIAECIERDEPFEAEEYWRVEMCGRGRVAEPRRALDYIGYMRLLAVMLTAPKPAPGEAPGSSVTTTESLRATKPATYRCDDCGHIESDPPLAADLDQRLDDDGVFTDRECSECGALTYEVQS